MFPLRVEADHRALTVWTPPSIHRIRGAIVLSLPALLAGLELGARIEETGARHAGELVLVSTIVALGLVVGVAQIALARRWSRRSVAVFDRVSGLVRRTPPAESVLLRDVAAIRVRHRTSGTALDLVGADGLLISVLYEKLPSDYWRDIARVVDAINAWLREPTGAPPELGARSARERAVLER